MKEWVKQQTAFLRALTGRNVARWHGIEMALCDVGPDGLPSWRDASISFLQLSRLDLIFSDGLTSSIITYQNEDRWGLFRVDDLSSSRLPPSEPHSIFRPIVLATLPHGEIRDVFVVLDQGDIREVRLEVAGREVLLLAGEVYEQEDGSLTVVTLDESILVQVDGRHP